MTLIYVGLVITMLIMLIGVLLMSVSEKLSDKFGNRFMNLRVIAQAVTIFLMFIIYHYKH